MIVSHIVAVAENGAIGKDNQLIWHLPADMKFFKNTTTGHHLLTGRKNYDSIGRPLPNRTTLIVTRNKAYQSEHESVKVFHNIEEAIDYAHSSGETELFIMGGGEIYTQSLPYTQRIYLTRLHHSFEADTFYPELDPTIWKTISEEYHKADEKNKYDYSFLVLEKEK